VIGETAVIMGGAAVGVDLHLPRLLGICGVDVVSIVEPDARRLSHLKDQFRGRRDIMLTPELPADGRYSVGVVATPAKFHLQEVERLIGRCTKLVIESPIARTLEEAEAIAAQFERSDATGFVCLVRRTLGNFRFVKQVLADGVFGDLNRVTVREGDVSALCPTSLSSFSRDLDGGGVLLDLGSHTLDLLFQVFDEVTLARAWIDADINRSCKAIEANCVLELEADKGVPVEVVLSRNRHLSNTAVFSFARGTLTLDVRDNTLSVAMATGCRLLGVPECGCARKMDVNDLFDAYYRQHVLPGTNQGVSPRDSLKAMRVIDDAYRGASFTEGGF